MACFLWAIDTLIRYPLVGSGISSLEIVTFEHIFLTAIFFLVFIKKITQLGELKLSHLFYFFIIGGVGSAIATLCFTRAFYVMNPSLVILLQKLQPLVAIVLARVVLGETIQKNFVIWAIVCIFGGILISYEQILQVFTDSFNGGSDIAYGYIFVLISVVGWGSATVFGKKLSTLGYSEVQIMAGRFFFGFLTLLPLYLTFQATKTYSMDVYSKILLMVLISGLLAMYFYYHGLKRISARACALAEMLFPFCAVIANWIFLGKTLSPIQIAGGVVLILGSSIIQMKKY